MTQRHAALGFKADDIKATVDRLANEVSALVTTGSVVAVPILTGGFRFASDLLAAMRLAPSALYVEPVTVRAYDVRPPARVKILTPPRPEILSGRTALVIDDICDRGDTLAAVSALCLDGGADKVISVALILRDGSSFTPTFHGFPGPRGVWYYGYGMDADGGSMRTLPFIVAEHDA